MHENVACDETKLCSVQFNDLIQYFPNFISGKSMLFPCAAKMVVSLVCII